MTISSIKSSQRPISLASEKIIKNNSKAKLLTAVSLGILTVSAVAIAIWKQMQLPVKMPITSSLELWAKVQKEEFVRKTQCLVQDETLERQRFKELLEKQKQEELKDFKLNNAYWQGEYRKDLKQCPSGTGANESCHESLMRFYNQNSERLKGWSVTNRLETSNGNSTQYIHSATVDRENFCDSPFCNNEEFKTAVEKLGFKHDGNALTVPQGWTYYSKHNQGGWEKSFYDPACTKRVKVIMQHNFRSYDIDKRTATINHRATWYMSSHPDDKV